MIQFVVFKKCHSRLTFGSCIWKHMTHSTFSFFEWNSCFSKKLLWKLAKPLCHSRTCIEPSVDGLKMMLCWNQHTKGWQKCRNRELLPDEHHNTERNFIQPFIWSDQKHISKNWKFAGWLIHMMLDLVPSQTTQPGQMEHASSSCHISSITGANNNNNNNGRHTKGRWTVTSMASLLKPNDWMHGLTSVRTWRCGCSRATPALRQQQCPQQLKLRGLLQTDDKSALSFTPLLLTQMDNKQAVCAWKQQGEVIKHLASCITKDGDAFKKMSKKFDLLRTSGVKGIRKTELQMQICSKLTTWHSFKGHLCILQCRGVGWARVVKEKENDGLKDWLFG